MITKRPSGRRFSRLGLPVLVLGAVLCCSAPRPAQAKMFELWASGLLGGAWGNGETDRDFFSWAGGGATGFEVGAKVLFLSAYVDYLRFFGGDVGAGLLGINLGGDGTFGLTKNLELVFRVAGTFYFGNVDEGATRTADDGTVIRSEEINTRGVGARGGVGLRYTFLRVFSVGITPQVGYHYFFGGVDEDIFDTAKNSSGWDFQALAYARFGIGI